MRGDEMSVEIGNQYTEFSRRALEHAVDFFADLSGPAPPILRDGNAAWYAIRGEHYTGLVVASRAGVAQARADFEAGRTPLQGAFAPEGSSAAIGLGGNLMLVRGNVTRGGYAFRVAPDARVVVEEHEHSSRGPEGQEFKLHIDLMFIVGDEVGGPEDRLEEFATLFRFASTVWRDETSSPQGEDAADGEG